MADYNPIRTVDGKALPCPSRFTYKIEDVSESDAGRTEDGMMHKKRIGQVVGLELSWSYINTATVSKILTAFDPEYIQVCYLDAKAGDYITAEFYVGNRSAPMYNVTKGLWESVSFNLIRRGVN